MTTRSDRRLGGTSGARELLRTLAAAPWFAVTPLLRPWHLRWGATAEEARGPMPGDQLVPRAQFRATRAIDIAAPPEQVWPWLVQVGFGRAGFYSYDLLDSLGRPSSTAVLEELQHPRVGDLAAPMTPKPDSRTSFTVAEVRPPHVLVWSKPDSSWAWRLEPTAGGTRLVTRLKQRYRPDPAGLLALVLLELGDFPMMRRMLYGVRTRAEQRTVTGTTEPRPPGPEASPPQR